MLGLRLSSTPLPGEHKELCISYFQLQTMCTEAPLNRWPLTLVFRYSFCRKVRPYRQVVRFRFEIPWQGGDLSLRRLAKVLQLIEICIVGTENVRIRRFGKRPSGGVSLERVGLLCKLGIVKAHLSIEAEFVRNYRSLRPLGRPIRA